MKRSEINQYIREAKAFMTKYHFMLPPWVDWTPDDWKSKGPECNDIRERAMGWDLTDFGWGDFLKRLCLSAADKLLLPISIG